MGGWREEAALVSERARGARHVWMSHLHFFPLGFHSDLDRGAAKGKVGQHAESTTLDVFVSLVLPQRAEDVCDAPLCGEVLCYNLGVNHICKSPARLSLQCRERH